MRSEELSSANRKVEIFRSLASRRRKRKPKLKKRPSTNVTKLTLNRATIQSLLRVILSRVASNSSPRHQGPLHRHLKQANSHVKKLRNLRPQTNNQVVNARRNHQLLRLQLLSARITLLLKQVVVAINHVTRASQPLPSVSQPATARLAANSNSNQRVSSQAEVPVQATIKDSALKTLLTPANNKLRLLRCR